MTALRSPDQRLAGRIALVTGATRGIGRAVAVGFAREGAHVIALGRTQGALEELDDTMKAEGLSMTLVPIDLEDANAANVVAQAIHERFGRLDILVANAGLLGGLRPINHYDAKVWNRVMEINVNANWRLIRAFDPLLRMSESARAIFVSSSVAKEPRAYWGAYAVSKAALEMMAGVYAVEVEKTPIRVNILDPGRTRTGMRAEAFPGEDPESLKAPEAVVDAFVDLASIACERHGETVKLSA